MSKYHYVRCVVTGNALAKSSSKGTASVKISLETVPKDGSTEQPRTLWADLWLTEKTMERTIETLEKTLGWQGKSFAELNKPVLAGVEVVAVCEWEVDDQGRDREKVAFLNSTAGGGVKRAEDADVRSIASQADGFLAMARANNPNKPKPAPRHARDRQRDDEEAGNQDYHY